MAQLRQFIDTYGTSQTYRLNLNDEQKQADIASLRELFWARSLIRANTGIPKFIGAIGINYRKRGFNVDVLTSAADIEFLSEPINDQAELIKVRDAYAYKSFQLATRAGDAMSKDLYMNTFDSVANAVTTINSLRTFIGGQSQLAGVAKVLVDELGRDAQEENLLMNGKFAEMRRSYQARWYTGLKDDEVKALKARGVAVMGGNAGATPGTGGPVAFNGAADATTFVGVVNKTMRVSQTYLSNYDRAQKILAAVAQFVNSSDSGKAEQGNAGSL
jgi:hypothetical protein